MRPARLKFLTLNINVAVFLLSFTCSIGIAKAETAFVIPGEYLVTNSASTASNEKQNNLQILKLPSQIKRRKRFHRYRNKCSAIKRQNSYIQSCTPNFVISKASTDPYIFTCTKADNCNWAIENANDTDIDLPQAWTHTEGDPSLVVAVLDTGLDLKHPDIQANLWVNANEIAGNGIDDDNNGYIDDIHGASMLNGAAPQDDNGHGTHVAGIIAATKGNSLGIAGAAPRIKVMAVKILQSNGNGTISDAIKGIDYVVNLVNSSSVPIVVFNNSWGGFIPTSEVSILREAFLRANQAGILATAAAGNGGTDLVGDNLDNLDYFPAKFNLPNLLTVAATDFSGKLASFSNYGATSVQITAPGKDIRSLLASSTTYGRQSENGTTLSSGTSMATPYVSAVLALIKSYYPDLTPIAIKDRILNRVYQLPASESHKVFTSGRLNALYAITDQPIPLPTALPEIPTQTPTVTSTATATATETQTVFASPTPELGFNPQTPTATPTLSHQNGQIPSDQISFSRLQTVSKNGRIQSSPSVKTANLFSLILNDFSSSEPTTLSVNVGKCLVLSTPVKNNSLFSVIRFKGAGRYINSLYFRVLDNKGQSKIEYFSSLTNSKKSKNKLNCKSIKRAISFGGLN